MSDPYSFGWPDELVDIHFPRGGPQKDASLPWYYFLTVQTPRYFQYIGSQLGGRGWQCEEFLPIIKILPIDPRKLTPTAPVGFSSLEAAARRAGTPGSGLSQDAFGRINFKNKFFWDVMGLKPPTWADFSSGLPKSRVGDGHRPINQYIGDTIKSWRDKWQQEAAEFNAATQAVQGSGSYVPYGAGPFALPVPGLGAGTYELAKLQANEGKWYFGATNPFILFQRGNAAFWKQPWAFKYEIGQLDSTAWDMNVFPPQDASDPLYTKPASAISGKYNGYGAINFPLNSPIIN